MRASFVVGKWWAEATGLRHLFMGGGGGGGDKKIPHHRKGDQKSLVDNHVMSIFSNVKGNFSLQNTLAKVYKHIGQIAAHKN